jgi:hypothetical protein
MTKTTSVLHNKEKVLAAIEGARSSREVLENLGLRAAGGNYKALKLSCEKLGIALPVYDKAKFFSTTHKIPNEKVFVKDSTYTSRANLKKRMFELGIPNICNECGQEPFWNGKPLSLTLEHKNGIWNDNRIENLEILCGHCHSQTATFAGRNTVVNPNPTDLRRFKFIDGEYIKRVVAKLCLDCNIEIKQESTRCVSCDEAIRGNITYPDTETLLTMIEEDGYVQVGKALGVSDGAVRKHLKKSLPADHPIFNKKKKNKK